MKTALIVTGEQMPPRHEQEAAAREWGAEQFWVDHTDDWIGNLRPDDEAGIFRIACLAPPGRYRSAKRLMKMVSRVDSVLRACVALIETDTGRRSDDKHQQDEMMDDAQKLRFHKSRPRKPGRPPKHEYGTTDLDWIRGIWLSREYKTVADREAAVRERFPHFNRSVFYRMFPNSGVRA